MAPAPSRRTRYAPARLPVSVPIHRDELADLKGANLWTVRNLLERLQELGDDDPWAAIGKTRQRLTKRFATA